MFCSSLQCENRSLGDHVSFGATLQSPHAYLGKTERRRATVLVPTILKSCICLGINKLGDTEALDTLWEFKAEGDSCVFLSTSKNRNSRKGFVKGEKSGRSYSVLKPVWHRTHQPRAELLCALGGKILSICEGFQNVCG